MDHPRAALFPRLPRAMRALRAPPVPGITGQAFGIGSDFDGGGEMQGWHDASESPNVTKELVRRGYDACAVAALWGGNFLRLMRAAEAGIAPLESPEGH